MTQKIIKSGQIKKENIRPLDGDSPKTGVLKSSNLLARKKARRIIQEAEKYARDLHMEAEIDAQEEIKKGFEKGFEKALFEIESNLLESREIKEKVLAETERDLLKLSIKLAEKIVGRELEKDSSAIIDLVNNALQNVGQQEKITLRVNPEDLKLVQEKIEDLKSYSQTKYLDLLGDPRVTTGGCLIESEVGKIDARLETQLKVLERVLLAKADGKFIKEI